MLYMPKIYHQEFQFFYILLNDDQEETISINITRFLQKNIAYCCGSIHVDNFSSI